MKNVTSQEDLIPKIYVTDDAVMQTRPICDGGLILGYVNETVMTKEVFVECYKKWVLGDAVLSRI